MSGTLLQQFDIEFLLGYVTLTCRKLKGIVTRDLVAYGLRPVHLRDIFSEILWTVHFQVENFYRKGTTRSYVPTTNTNRSRRVCLLVSWHHSGLASSYLTASGIRSTPY